MDVFETEEDLRPFVRKPKIPRTPPRRGEVEDKRPVETPPQGQRRRSNTVNSFESLSFEPAPTPPPIAYRQPDSGSFTPISSRKPDSGSFTPVSNRQPDSGNFTPISFGFERLSLSSNAVPLSATGDVGRQIADGSRQSRDHLLKMTSQVSEPSLVSQRLTLRSHRRHASLSDSINMRKPMKAQRLFPLSQKLMKSAGAAPNDSDDNDGGEIGSDDDDIHSDCNCELCEMGAKANNKANNTPKRPATVKQDEDDIPVYHSKLTKSVSFPKSKKMLRESKITARNWHQDNR